MTETLEKEKVVLPTPPTPPLSPSAAKRRLGWVRKLIPAAIMVLAVVGVFGLTQIPSQSKDMQLAPTPPVNVELTALRTIRPGSPDATELRDVYEQSGVVMPNHVVSIAAEVAGAVQTLSKTKGDIVKAGDVLATLDTELIDAEIKALEATVKGLEAKVKFDQNELKRIKALGQASAATNIEVDTAQASLDASAAQRDAAKANLVASQARLKRARIVAPITGTVDAPLALAALAMGRSVEVGDYLQSGACLCTIVDISTAKVALDVPEQDLPCYKVGQQHEVAVRAGNGTEARTIPATISYISKLSDPSAHTTRIELSIPNKEGLLYSGQMVDVRLTRRVLDNLIRVPLDAIIPLEGGKAVYVAEGFHKNAQGQVLAVARQKNVTLGIVRGSKDIQVISGLSDGQKLILPQGNRYVSDGQTVRVVGDNATLESLNRQLTTQPAR